MRICSKCKQEKPTKEFYNDKKRKDGLTPYIEVISRLANTMKNNATAEELVLFAEGILRRNQKVG